MTRNTKIHKLKNIKLKDGSVSDILFRDLTVLELKFFDGIKNPVVREELAGKTAIINLDPQDVDWPVLSQIGKLAFEYSSECIENDIVFESTIKEFRESVNKDPVLTMIATIKKHLPSESIIDLMNLTMKDLLEISCFCEVFSGTQEWKTGNLPGKKKQSLINTADLPEEAKKQLRDRIAELNTKMR